MANNNFSFLTVVAVALVVAVVVSLITASITGNVIKVKEKDKGTEVYTKAEIDTILTNITQLDAEIKTKTIKQDVLNMLNKCNIVGVFSGDRNSTLLKSCSETCVNYQETCVLSSLIRSNISTGEFISTELFECSRNYNSIWRATRNGLNCVCCKP